MLLGSFDFFALLRSMAPHFAQCFYLILGSVLCHLEHKLINIAKKW